MIVIVMGVSSSGKTTAGRRIADHFGWRFVDADDHHPKANRDKMAQGVPLTDDDRWPWLHTLLTVVGDKGNTSAQNCVLACSALKRDYRNVLRGRNINNADTNTTKSDTIEPRLFLFLQIDFPTAQERLTERRGHFFNPALLKDQFECLEEPDPVIESDVRVVSSSTCIAEILLCVENALIAKL